jgi:serine/threonine protein kinase
VLRNLNHPKIPRYQDYFLVDKQPGSELSWWGLVQDYIPGLTLQELLEQSNKFSEQQLRTIAEEVLQILTYLHGLNPPVLHRDIKLSNLIWGENEQIYLVDFGAVQDRATVTGMTFTVVGTSGYAPLEQFWGKAVPASDLYALGATLIHLLTGVAPAELPQSNLQIQFRDRTNLNSNFVAWIEKLTAPALEQRFATAHQALVALKQNDSISFPLTVCTHTKKRLRNRVCTVVENSAMKLEIHKVLATPKALDIYFYVFFAIFLFVLLSFMPFSIDLEVIVKFLLSGLIGVFIVDPNFVRSLINNEHKDKPRRYFVRFDLKKNCFEFSNYLSAFKSSRGEGLISDIRYISIDETVYGCCPPYSAGISYWDVIIRTDRSYKLSWQLTEAECVWLVHEIQTWLNSIHKSNPEFIKTQLK